jgi:hypothetical protein
MSAALSLVGILVFAATGLTLNNAGWIDAQPDITNRTLAVPPALLAILTPPAQPSKAPLPEAVESWIEKRLGIQVHGRSAEYSDNEIYLSLPEPGGDAWLSISLDDGQLEYERSVRGWIAYFNDLHKGRHTGLAWSWFIDALALACIIFSLTGLFLLHLHSGRRWSTWPLVGLGLVAPLVVMLLFLH